VNSIALKVALRADASTEIGYGHVKRCLALAQALQEVGAEVRLVSRALGVDTRGLAERVGCAHVFLRGPSGPAPQPDVAVPAHAHWAQVDWDQDATETAQALRNWAPHWVVVDHYAFDARWHRAVEAALSTQIAAIDDLADRDLGASLVIDHNYAKDHRAKYAGRIIEAAHLLGGPRFALLGPSYARASRYEFNATVRSIGIFMGGTDGGNLSSLALRACREHARFTGLIEIATTRANPHFEVLNALADCWPPTTIVSDLPDLAGFFANHDLQIGAGGGATWERCCIGVPTLAVAAAANQRAVVEDLASLGVLATIEPMDDLNPVVVGRALNQLMQEPGRRQSLARSSQQLVDGLGARRVALWMSADRISVRRACMKDAQRIYDWRNHPTTRAKSVDGNEITWPAHLAWLQRCLADPNRMLLVGSVGSIPVGVIRLDRHDQDDVAISIYLDPGLHGLRLGSALLRAGESAMSADCRNFVATVLGSNTKSQRLFAGAGYQSVGNNTWRKCASEQERGNPSPCSD